MITNLFNKNNEKSKTGIYVFNNSNLTELEKTPGNGSINDIIKSIGFSTNLVHTVFTFDSKKIEVLGFKIFSKEVLFAIAKSKRKISIGDISKERKLINWQTEYSSLNVEEILQEGINAKNLSFDFLNEVLELTPEGKNLFKSEEFELYLQFENNLLQAFASSEWDNSSSKFLKEINESMYLKMVEEAKKYHDNDIDAMQEVKNQSNSFLDIPEAINNEFIGLHKKSNGNVNFYNLLIAHYIQDCELEEFIFMNKGRYKKFDELRYEIGKFIYEFDESNKLVNVYRK